MSSPRQVLQQFTRAITLRPGLSSAARAVFREQLGVKALPEDVDELLAYAAGFEQASREAVRFTGHEGFAFEQVFPLSVPVLPDGSGNFWVVDVNPHTGAWGPVFFASHDPSVVVVQAPDLQTFLTQLLDPSAGDALGFVENDATRRLVKHDPWLRPVGELRASADEAIRAFAERLPGHFRIADLRPRQIGSGFTWGLKTEIRRHGTELIFGLD